jgi:hypothetical protein
MIVDWKGLQKNYLILISVAQINRADENKMSAFICTSDVYKNIFSGFLAYRFDYKRCNDLVNKYGDITKVLKKFYAYNVRGVNARYGEKTPLQMPKELLDESTVYIEPISRAQFLKSLQCVHYQMAEGNIPMLKFYKEVAALIDEISRPRPKIMESSEYKEAKWG